MKCGYFSLITIMAEYQTGYQGMLNFRVNYSASSSLLVCLFLIGANFSHADLAGLSSSFSNDIERAAGIANQQTFDELNAPGGLCPLQDNAAGPSGSCTGAVFEIYSNVRELVHTANDIQGTGISTFSLGLGEQDLGFALRWTAGEEFAAQGSMSSNFVNGQLSGLASRLGALRAVRHYR